MRLYFLRHAEAVDIADSDHARQLTERGIKRTKTAAKVMKKLDIAPNYIFASPRIRAKHTAEIVGETLGVDVTISEEVNFGFSVTGVKMLTDGMSSDLQVMFVGHNPSMSEVVNRMSGATIAMKKGGLARIDLYSPHMDRGELVWLIAPKVFDALGD